MQVGLSAALKGCSLKSSTERLYPVKASLHTSVAERCSAKPNCPLKDSLAFGSAVGAGDSYSGTPVGSPGLPPAPLAVPGSSSPGV